MTAVGSCVDDGDMTLSAAAERARRLRDRLHKPWIDEIDGPLWPQVVAETKINFRPPFEVLSVVIINIGLALGAWFFINPDIVLNHTALVFLPIALASWAYADVPATNLFGARAEQVLERMDRPVQIRRIMTVENIGLWILISPGCLLLSLGLLPGQHEPIISIAICVAVLSMPLAYLGLAAIMAPLLPFHPLPWRERVRRRDTWLRYSLAITIAYFGLTWPASILAVTPAAYILRYVGQEPVHYLIAAVLVTPWCIFLWRAGLHISTWIARRRGPWLHDVLADPERG
jgi:hypothetical protein